MTTHTVPSDVFNRLAAGDGDTLGVLRAGQRSKRLLLLHEVVSTARSRAPGTFAEANGEEALAVLVDAHRRSPSRVDELVLQPHVGAWAMHCLRSMLCGKGAEPADLGHLGAIAASAAVRAGQAFEVTTYLRDGAVMFPSFGQARLGAGAMPGWCRIRTRSGTDRVEITTEDAEVTVPIQESTGPGETWRPLRRLHSQAEGLELTVQLDDLDSYRDCGHLPASDRLDQAVVEDWQAKLDEAWPLLVRDHPVQAEAIAAGVVSFVPLVPSIEKPELSATCHQAIGALAMTPPRNAVSLALALVHELQHTKLSALLDLLPLINRARSALFYAPWRSDPRPLRGLLHGTYAYLGLTGFWETHRHRDRYSDTTASGELAHFEFALWRDQVAGAVDTLRRSGLLTAAGTRFLDGMERRLSQFLRLPVPVVPQSLARMAGLDHWWSWRLRNLRPDPEQTQECAHAWLTGRALPDDSRSRVSVVDGRGPMPSDARLALLRGRLAAPGKWEESPGDANPADIHLVESRLADAANTYRARISRDPDDLASWAGLALARHHLPTGATRALTTCPELVHALYKAVLEQTGTAPDVEDLAAWMSRGNLR